MFRAIHGVQLDTFPGFKFRGRAFAFPEAYNLRAPPLRRMKRRFDTEEVRR